MDEADLYAPDPDRWRSLGRKLGWMLAALFLFFGLLYLVRDAGLFEPSPVRLADVRLSPEPPYPLAKFMAETQALGKLPDVLPATLGPQFLPLTEALARHPYIEAVEELRHLARDDIEILVRYRVPVLEITQGDDRYFVSRQGVVLPFSVDLKDRPIRVDGLKLPRKVQPGDKLQGPDLAPIFAAAASLRHEWSHWKLTHLSIHADGVLTTLRLHSAGGSVIQWRTLNDAAQDVSDDEKTHRLRVYLRQLGSFEKPSGPYLLDVRPKSGLTRAALR